MKITPPKIPTTQDTLKVAPQEPKTKNPSTTTKPQKKSKSDDTGYSYCYVLVTQSQKDVIQVQEYLTLLKKELFIFIWET